MLHVRRIPDCAAFDNDLTVTSDNACINEALLRLGYYTVRDVPNPKLINLVELAALIGIACKISSLTPPHVCDPAIAVLAGVGIIQLENELLVDISTHQRQGLHQACSGCDAAYERLCIIRNRDNDTACSQTGFNRFYFAVRLYHWAAAGLFKKRDNPAPFDRWVVRSAPRFGCRFAVYADDPEYVHSSFLVIEVDLYTTWRSIRRITRIAGNASKKSVILFDSSESADGHRDRLFDHAIVLDSHRLNPKKTLDEKSDEESVPLSSGDES